MLQSIKELFSGGLNAPTIVSFIDILITAAIIYIILDWMKGTQALQVVKGVFVILLLTQVSGWIGLITINYILKNLITVGLIALVVMFQPELRRALEKLGSTRLRSFLLNLGKSERFAQAQTVIEQITGAVGEMSKTKTGALIVIERNTKLKDIIDTGTHLDATITKPLLLNIFTPKTPLHDGAVIISGDDMRIKAAGCLLPLTQNRNLKQEIGTRHRSAIGMSEHSDSFIIIVSEETGVISYATNGRLSRFLDIKTLTNLLNEILCPEEQRPLLGGKK